MPGGVLQLAAYGAQDFYLTGNPQISFFKTVYRRYTNFAMEFYKLTNVPTILNTSFNENEPIVKSPQEAIDCFYRTNMDILVLDNWLIKRN